MDIQKRDYFQLEELGIGDKEAGEEVKWKSSFNKGKMKSGWLKWIMNNGENEK